MLSRAEMMQSSEDTRSVAIATREGYRAMLSMLSADDRRRILIQMADNMEARQDEILQANARDVTAAQSSPSSILSRLKLTEEKLRVLCDGIRGIAAEDGHIGREISCTELATGLVLQNVTCPIGMIRA